ncbi:NADH pyrophosphatase [Dimargaris verticillata]|uniref:NAD(+) diphosphatase n=1 Tax=Dimargaris verticillata TaxID=2761393 RepID=A0A9W8EDY6_9FUNG|nr:NADH pyrophosphatase [Dimargaris verticillata]
MAQWNRTMFYRRLLEQWSHGAWGSFEDAGAGSFSGYMLNRLGPQRTNTPLLAQLFASPKANFIIFQGDQLLVTATQPRALGYLGAREILECAPNPFTLSDPPINSPGLEWVFLGIDKVPQPNSTQATEMAPPDQTLPYDQYPSYWVVDISLKASAPDSPAHALAQKVEATVATNDTQLAPLQRAAFGLSIKEGAILAQAVTMVDWNRKNRFCPGCGRPTVSSDAGYKRNCVTEPAGSVDPTAHLRPPCVNRHGVHNSMYPRTDPAVIACVTSSDGNRVLLGRKKSFPKRWYTCVAGFIEPGESMEDAVRREVQEETGIRVGPVMYYASQPWQPFPNQLMLGCIAQAVIDDIAVEDDELEDVQWFTREQAVAAVNRAKASLATSPSSPSKVTAPTSPTNFSTPPPHSIAYQLIHFWATSQLNSPRL